jgi:hypothetical protein
MGEQYAAWADAMLRRPAVDPGIPDADRALLTAHSALLTPADQDRPTRRRDYLPTDPAKRLQTVDGAVMGMTSAMVTAVFGAVPLAVGTLLLEDPTSWEYASNRYSLLLAQLIAIVTAVVLGVRIARFGQPNGRVPATQAAHTYHGRYLTDADFDARSRVLLRRAQDAIDSVLSSEVCAADLLDQAAARVALASQEWEIAVALREQARLRARRSELPAVRPGSRAATLLGRQTQAARVAEASVAGRVAALERYAAEVQTADTAWRDWQHAAAVAELEGQHLDMLARTAADEHGLAQIEVMTQQARAIQSVLREPPGQI